MLKRVALLGSIAALTMGSAGSASAQDWGGGGWGGGGWDGGGWGGGGWGGGGWGGGAVTVTVSGFPRPFPFRRPCCERPFIPRPVFCCERPFFGRPFFRPPYFYGDHFAPYAYNWNADYGYGGYGGW
jgi:hypothetical protein